jgi:chemosensory pili system protein ChpA (sensor histidine kinase/response regulator)
MSEDENPSLDENELTEDDLAVLRAFEAMEDWNVAPGPSAHPTASSSRSDSPAPAASFQQVPNTGDGFNDMLLVFVSEVEEDIARMQRALNQLEQDDHIQLTRFVPIKRAAHKIRGTASAVECPHMSTLGHHIEVIVEQITESVIFPLIGVNALAKAVQALEQMLESLAETGAESAAPLAEFEAACVNMGLDLSDAPSEKLAEMAAPSASTTPQSPLQAATTSSESDLFAGASIPLMRIERQRIERLVYHSERLTELRTPMEIAQAQMTTALQELHAAQARLQQLEPALSNVLTAGKPLQLMNERATSSLIARIFHKAEARNDSSSSRKRRADIPANQGVPLGEWDELNIERYTDKDIMQRSLREAVADVAVATAHVQAAATRLDQALQAYTTQVSTMRSDVHLLRLAPLRMLVPLLRQAITQSLLAQVKRVEFEVAGDATEVDQDILEGLAPVLLQLLHTCLADADLATATTGRDAPETAETAYRIWLDAREFGGTIALEMGFSMPVHGGAIEAVRGAIQNLNGTIALQRNASGGVSFLFSLPRLSGCVRGLLLRVGEEQMLAPHSQVWRVSDSKREQFDMLYHLHDLLGFAAPQAAEARIRPVLVMTQSVSHKLIGVVVDEVIDEVEVVVKPLAAHLRRPGVSGAAIDGRGNVSLLIDVPELISLYAVAQHRVATRRPPLDDASAQYRAPKILVADDSVYQRHSVSQTLMHANYDVTEASDGMDALEKLLENTPDIFLLDIEMPNLNGYDLLNIVSLYPELAGMKIIMLTSRKSEKHRKRAFDLGAYAYLTKPCPLDELLETVQKALQS